MEPLKATIYAEPIWEKNQDEAKVFLPVYLEKEKKTAKVYLPNRDFEKVLKTEIGEGDLVVLDPKQKKGDDFVLEALEEEKNFFRKKEIAGVIHEKVFLDKNGKKCEEKEAAEVLFNVAVPKKNIEKQEDFSKIKPIDAFDLYGLRFGILEYKTNQKLKELKEKEVIKVGGTVEKKADGSREFNSISGGISFVPEEKKEAILNGYNIEKKEIEENKTNTIFPEIKHVLREEDLTKKSAQIKEKPKQKELIL